MTDSNSPLTDEDLQTFLSRAAALPPNKFRELSEATRVMYVEHEATLYGQNQKAAQEILASGVDLSGSYNETVRKTSFEQTYNPLGEAVHHLGALRQQAEKDEAGKPLRIARHTQAMTKAAADTIAPVADPFDPKSQAFRHPMGGDKQP